MTDQQRWARSRPRLRFSTDDRLIGLVRRGDPTAFEILYDRHSRELLSFCSYMLGSRHDAEDAVQATFASAYKALIADEREIVLRPWLFAIARNACLSVLRQRRPQADDDQDVASHEDPLVRVEQREDLRAMLATMLELPERQRTALVLAEMHGLSHEEIGVLLGVRASQVKSYVYQARSTLISERQARGADCVEIREELSAARGAALLKGHLRRHLRSCADCSAYAERLSQQRRQFGALMPLAPALALKRRALEAALGQGSGAGAGTPLAGPTAELAGEGLKMLVVKALAVAACVGAGAGVGVGAHMLHASTPESHRAGLRLALDASKRATGIAVRERVPIAAKLAPPAASRGVHAGVGGTGPAPSAKVLQGAPGGSDRVPAAVVAGRVSREPGASGVEARGGGKSGGEVGGKGEEPHGAGEAGKAEEPHGKSEEPHGAGEEPHGAGEAGRAEEPHGKSEEAHGKSEEPHGAGEAGKAEEPHGKSEEAHGKPEEPHANGSEAARGKSEEQHGKAK